MIIKLPRNLTVDINDVPDDFDEIIKNTFRDYTEGTNEDYRYQDKLAFIDHCVALLHKDPNEDEAVKQLILDRAEFELDEYGDLPDKDDFWSLEFMAQCYKQGKEDSEMYSSYYSETECIANNDKHLNDKIMKLLERIIKVVINYEQFVESTSKRVKCGCCTSYCKKDGRCNRYGGHWNEDNFCSKGVPISRHHENDGKEMTEVEK